MLRKLWLLFAQACTLCLAVLFVVATLRPDLLSRGATRAQGVVLHQETSTPVLTPAVASHADAAKKAMPAVVNIYTSKEMRQRSPLADDALMRRYFPDLAERMPRQRVTNLGSGVIVAREGFVLTNHHVIDGADDIQLVLNDGRQLRAHVRGVDPESDLAVLKADEGDLPAITFGSIDHVQVGDTVLAIGNPFGFGNTVTSGIVSALGRNHLDINQGATTYQDFIQTDAAINLGNSGGALVDAAGNLIGINSMIYSQTGGSLGIGFAIPVSIARNVLEQIISNGEVTRGWLGIDPQDLVEGVLHGGPQDGGVAVKDVKPGSPAERAGIHTRDIVVDIGGKPTRNTQALSNRIAELAPGTAIKVKIWRDGSLQDFDVTVGKRAPPRQ